MIARRRDGRFRREPIARRNPKNLDAREKIGRGAKNGRVSGSKPGSHEHMILEGRKAAWAAVLRRRRQGRRSRISSARGEVHEASNRIAGVAEVGSAVEVERLAAKRADVGGREPGFCVPARDGRGGVGRAGQGVIESAGGW